MRNQSALRTAVTSWVLTLSALSSWKLQAVEGGGGGGGDAHDIFSAFFGGGMGRRQQRGPRKGEDREIPDHHSDAFKSRSLLPTLFSNFEIWNPLTFF